MLTREKPLTVREARGLVRRLGFRKVEDAALICWGSPVDPERLVLDVMCERDGDAVEVHCIRIALAGAQAGKGRRLSAPDQELCWWLRGRLNGYCTTGIPIRK
jgi:hypothetical protein